MNRFVFIFQSSQLGLMPYPRDIMSWTEKIYANAFANQQFCLKENDYVFGNHKIGGNAQGKTIIMFKSGRVYTLYL